MYTGNKAERKDAVIPKKFIQGTDEVHNWANNIPISVEYQIVKQNRLPNELELKAQELFFKIESIKLRLFCYEEELRQVQEKIKETMPKVEIPKPNPSKKLEKEFKMASHERKVVQPAEEKLDLVLEKRKKIWE